jgi:hypothetical protein
MSERSIFLNALDMEPPAARAAYLDEACAGRPELRRRIERLLRAHQMGGAFLDVPAPEQLLSGDQVLAFLAPPGEPGALGRLDHYDVLEVVGRGATGVVLKARDSKLQRVVALKVLAPRLARGGPARERFVREAQATAAVRDDHVIAVHAVSDDGPLPYLVMEYIAGVTQEERIAPPSAEKAGPAPVGPRPWRSCLLLVCLLVMPVGLAALATVLKPWQRGKADAGPGDTTAREGDGRSLVTANANGTVYLLRVPPPAGPDTCTR